MYKKNGFTLLEIIIVIVVLLALLLLAMPKMFSMIEYTRSNEAMQTIASIRKALNKCHMLNGQTYVGCDIDELILEDPNSQPDVNFSYTIFGQSNNGYTIEATRLTNDGGDGISTITYLNDGTDIFKSGTGVFKNIK